MTSSSLFLEYNKRLRYIQYTLRNGEAAYIKGHIGRRDCGRLFTGSFLEAVVAFELSLEKLFLAYLTGDCVTPRPYQTIVSCRNTEVAARLVRGGSKYVDWLPLERFETISKIYFETNVNPVIGCASAHGSEIQKCLFVRNYIAHMSSHSERQFKQHVVGPTLLPPRQRDIFGYFRFGHTMGVTKIEYHLGELQRALRWLCF